jgi:hypothetical protein
VAESGRTPPIDPYDITAPSVPVFTRPPRYVTTTSVPVAWSSTDDRSGVGFYTVRMRSAPAAGAFGRYADLFASTPNTSATVAAAPGHSYCFVAMATDRWSNQSAWSDGRCVTVPVDDRGLAASPGWTRVRAPGFYLGSARSTTTRGATLIRDGLRAHRIRVVAETCPSCGRIQVRWNGAIIGTFELVTRTTLHRRLLGEVLLPSVEVGTLELRVMSARRPVVIDGVAVTRL